MKSEDKLVLEHIVPDADAWDAHQRAFLIEKFGTEEGHKRADANLAAKVKRWQPEYDRESKRQDYKNRKQRDEAEKSKDR